MTCLGPWTCDKCGDTSDDEHAPCSCDDDCPDHVDALRSLRASLAAARSELTRLTAIVARVAGATNGYWNSARLGEDHDRAEVALHEIANALGEPF